MVVISDVMMFRFDYSIKILCRNIYIYILIYTECIDGGRKRVGNAGE